MWANPAPWIFYAVAVLCACLGGVQAGLVPLSSAPLLIGVLLACALPQLLGAIICFRRGEILLATIAGSFETVITLGAAFTMWIQIFKAPAPGAFTGEIMGFFWITLFIVTEVVAIGFGRVSWFILLFVAEVGVMFLLLAIFVWLGIPVLGIIAGWLATAAKRGVPIVVAPGGLDCIVFNSIEDVPDKLKGRKLHPHDIRVAVRTSEEELERIAMTMARRLANPHGPVGILIPSLPSWRWNGWMR